MGHDHAMLVPQGMRNCLSTGLPCSGPSSQSPCRFWFCATKLNQQRSQYTSPFCEFPTPIMCRMRFWCWRPMQSSSEVQSGCGRLSGLRSSGSAGSSSGSEEIAGEGLLFNDVFFSNLTAGSLCARPFGKSGGASELAIVAAPLPFLLFLDLPPVLFVSSSFFHVSKSCFTTCSMNSQLCGGRPMPSVRHSGMQE